MRCFETATQSLLDNVEKNFTRAERDNDLIYHQDVPALTSLPTIVEVSMVQATVPGGLTDPKAALGDDAIIFSELVGHGARMAIGEPTHDNPSVSCSHMLYSARHLPRP